MSTTAPRPPAKTTIEVALQRGGGRSDRPTLTASLGCRAGLYCTGRGSDCGRGAILEQDVFRIWASCCSLIEPPPSGPMTGLWGESHHVV